MSKTQNATTLFRKRLLIWFSQNGRSLPWRTTSDPYAIVVSEIMLQQTQVDRVIPKYYAWLKAFPNWKRLASASQVQTLKLWNGLGYNRRALMLQRLAHEVIKNKDGELPRSAMEMQKLPGIGPYTAQAVGAFAFRLPKSAPVDTNVARIIRRVFGLQSARLDVIADVASDLVPRDVWTWNHAMMDFGALVCTARQPKCAACPMRDTCEAYRLGDFGASKKSQTKFIGSDRMFRGRILQALHAGPSALKKLAKEIGLEGDPKRFEKVLNGLAKEGFVECRRNIIYIKD